MSKQKSIDEITAQWDAYERPRVDEKYIHYKGGEYVIVATGYLEETETPCVVYKSLETDTVWVRTAENFLETVEEDGNVTQRFTRQTSV